MLSSSYFKGLPIFSQQELVMCFRTSSDHCCQNSDSESGTVVNPEDEDNLWDSMDDTWKLWQCLAWLTNIFHTCLGCPGLGCLNNRCIYSTGGWKFKKVISLARFRWGLFSWFAGSHLLAVSLHDERDHVSHVSFRGTNWIHEGSPSNDLITSPKVPPPNTITLEVRASKMDLGAQVIFMS